jgi:uncharacterized protein (DUF58 family)
VSRASRIAALGAALVAAGGAFAVSALYVPGVALVVLALAAEGIVRLAAAAASVTLRPGCERIEEGASTTLSVHAGGWAFALCRGELCGMPGGEWLTVSSRGTALELAVRPVRRGELGLGPATVRFGDPFGICRRELRSSTVQMLVLPRVEPIPRERLDRVIGLGRASAPVDEGPDVEGLRPYRQGAPAARIHWLTVARVGELVERRAERDAKDMPFLVVLDAGSPISEQALDMAVRAAASLCVALAGAGGCSLLLPGDAEAQAVRPDLRTWPYLHERLARLQAGGRVSWAAAERAGAAIWVGARRPEAERTADTVCLTVSPLPREDRRAEFVLAGCTVQAAGRAARSVA